MHSRSFNNCIVGRQPLN